MAKVKTSALLRVAGKGTVRARDLDAGKIPRAYLQRLTERGLLEQVGRGLYRLAGAPVTDLNSVADVAKRVPHAIMCLLSALQIHDLTTEAPHAVWIMIDRHARAPKLAYPKLEIVWASGRARTHGIERRTIEGVRVQLTTPAKTVADCFRFAGMWGSRSRLRRFATISGSIAAGSMHSWRLRGRTGSTRSCAPISRRWRDEAAERRRRVGSCATASPRPRAWRRLPPPTHQVCERAPALPTDAVPTPGELHPQSARLPSRK